MCAFECSWFRSFGCVEHRQLSSHTVLLPFMSTECSRGAVSEHRFARCFFTTRVLHMYMCVFVYGSASLYIWVYMYICVCNCMSSFYEHR